MTLNDAKILIATPQITRLPLSQKWADLGCGQGLFSKALIELLPANSLVYAMDKSQQSITHPGITFNVLDFEKDPLPVPMPDGILMANSLHFIQDKPCLLKRLKANLSPVGMLLLVEYDTNNSNPYVPYPISLSTAIPLFEKAGFHFIEKIGERPSVYGRSNIYSALFRGV